MSPEIPPGTPSPSERPCERHDDVRDFGGQRIGTGPCVDREGRTLWHPTYVFPSRGNRIVRWSGLAAVLLPVALIGLYFLGTPARQNRGGLVLRTALAPGPNSSRHSMATMDCAQCHRVAHNVEDARCERCHDVPLSARLSNAAHVFQGTSDTARAMVAPVVPCATCHVEHRGAGVQFADVDDRECGSCHRVQRNGTARLTTLRRHPEFAIVREGSETGSGLRWFNHQMHVPKVQKKFKKTCDACHERSPTAAAFAPISFPRHCATCHEADLADSPGTMPTATVASLGALPPPLRTRTDPDDPARELVTGLRHADPWLVSTVQALRATFNPSGAAAERAILDRQVVQLELRLTFGAAAPGDVAWTRLEPALRTSGMATDASPSADDGVSAAAAAVESLVSTLPAEDETTRALLREAARLKQGITAAPPRSAPAATGGVEPLRQLLLATMARGKAAGDASVVQRAAALIARLDTLGPAARRSVPSGAATAGITALLQDLGTAGDPRVRSDAWRLNDLAQIAQRQVAGGIDPLAFDLHRQRTLRLLDTVQQTLPAQRQSGSDPAEAGGLLARVSALRQRILATDYGIPATVAAARAMFFRARQIDRARVDTELEAAGLRLAAPLESDDDRQESLQRRLVQLRRELVASGSASRLAGPLPPDEARRVIATLLGSEAQDAEQNALQKNRCTLCHELGPGGEQLAPMRAAGGSLLLKATFTHRPHVTGDSRSCETCHTGIRASTRSSDLNLPGVASCVTCHAPGKQAAGAIGCESCHKYHVRSSAALVWEP